MNGCIETVDRVLFAAVLRHTNLHLTQASELLGLSRPTLRHKLLQTGHGSGQES